MVEVSEFYRLLRRKVSRSQNVVLTKMSAKIKRLSGIGYIHIRYGPCNVFLGVNGHHTHIYAILIVYYMAPRAHIYYSRECPEKKPEQPTNTRCSACE